MSKSICVTIDGPSASGKSTVAKKLAQNLGFLHIDTGAIYRSMALFCLENGVDTNDESIVHEALKKFHYELVVEGDLSRHMVNAREVTDLIRKSEISQISSMIAAFPSVRLIANEFQRKIAMGRSVVIDARDAGTVVFPEAQVKVFLTAQRKERAKRRLRELSAKYKGDDEMTLDKVLAEMQERDERDQKRENSPLKRALDAIAIDTTHLSVDSIVKKIEKIVQLEQDEKKPSRFWSYFVGEQKAKASFGYKAYTMIIYGILRFFYRLQGFGMENIPKGAAIIAPSHVSFLDPFAVGVVCPNELYFLAHEYLFRIPIGGKIMAKMNVMPLLGSAQDAGVLKQIAAFLLKKKQVMIFPEGTRSDNGEIKPLKRGIALLSSIADCPVVPVFVKGAYKAWPRNRKFPRLFGKISVHFGKPLYWKDFESKADSKKEAQILMTEELSRVLKKMHAELGV